MTAARARKPEAVSGLMARATAGEKAALALADAPAVIVQLTLPAPRPYHLTQSDLWLIADYYEKTEADQFDLDTLAAVLGRHKSSICRAARRLSLTRQGRAHQPTVRANAGAKQAQTIRQCGHPRGFLGATHSLRTRSILSKKSIEMWKTAKATGTGVMSPANRQLYSDIASKSRALLHGEAVYTRARGGVRPDIGPMYFRSAWEANYARYLMWLQGRGDIDSWEYEPETFWFDKIKRGVRSYRPDFRVTEKGKVYYVEVKGWMDDKSKTKIKRMRKYHPHVDLRLFVERDYRSLKEKLSRIIPGWE